MGRFRTTRKLKIDDCQWLVPLLNKSVCFCFSDVLLVSQRTQFGSWCDLFVSHFLLMSLFTWFFQHYAVFISSTPKYSLKLIAEQSSQFFNRIHVAEKYLAGF